MPEVKYGEKVIKYAIENKDGLKSHYISVEKNTGVVLKGSAVSPLKAEQLILKKAKWIIDKLALLENVEEGDIVTGSRIQYLGRRYYVVVEFDDQLSSAEILFNHSQFKIKVNPSSAIQEEINLALFEFYREKAVEKIMPRIKKWSKMTGLSYTNARLMKLEKRWGSCTAANTIILNINTIKLPYSLIDYVIVHELCHTKVKNHSKDYWAELSKHMPNWKALDERMMGVRL